MASASKVLREILVRLGVTVKPGTKKQVKQFDKDISELKGSLQDLAAWALKAGVALATAGIGAATAAGYLAVSTGQQAAAIEQQAAALNLSREEYQKTVAVFDRFGADAGEVADVFQQINSQAVAAMGGSKSAAESFANVGIKISDLKNKRPNELFEMIADGSANAADRMKAMSGVSTLLGEDSAKKMAPALRQGAAAIRAMAQEAEDLGLIMSDDQLAVAKGASDQWRKLTTVLRGVRNELGVALAPVVTKYLRLATEWIRTNRELISNRIERWVRGITGAVELATAAVRAVGGWDAVFKGVALGGGLLLLLANLSTIETVIGGVAAGFRALVYVGGLLGVTITGIPFALFIAALGSILLLFIGIGVAIDDVATWFRGGDSWLGTVLDTIERAIPAFGQFRDMIWQVVQASGTLWRSVKLIGSALVDSFRPALVLLEPLLMTLRDIMADLSRDWAKLNQFIGAGFNLIGSTALAGQAGFEGEAGTVANNIRSKVGGTVQRAVEYIQAGPRNPYGGGGNKEVNTTINVTGGSREDVEAALGRVMRKAGLQTKGGRQ
jgi:hypothetical protein